MLAAIVAVAVLVGAGYWTRSAGHLKWASFLAWIPATPLLFYGLFILMFVIFQPDFK